MAGTSGSPGWPSSCCTLRCGPSRASGAGSKTRPALPPRLSHPNILAVFDFGEHDDNPFIVLERLPGQTLAHLIGSGPMPPQHVRSLLDDVLAGLGAAHRAGMLHRDIKPGNVLVSAAGDSVKVADFGIAKTATATHTATGHVVGTMSYPLRRFTNTEQMRAALAGDPLALASGAVSGPVPARPPTKVLALSSLPRRRGSVRGFVIAAVAVVALVVSGLASASDPSPSVPPEPAATSPPVAPSATVAPTPPPIQEVQPGPGPPAAGPGRAHGPAKAGKKHP